ncbi:uncharacterized protein [Drosophila kikkawai]|uniref:Uncharacterized protein n=1 Tax=Drosophila kikkawai TaxID=30033 RepID=A0ABM4GE36_DROKI
MKNIQNLILKRDLLQILLKIYTTFFIQKDDSPVGTIIPNAVHLPWSEKVSQEVHGRKRSEKTDSLRIITDKTHTHWHTQMQQQLAAGGDEGQRSDWSI